MAVWRTAVFATPAFAQDIFLSSASSAAPERKPNIVFFLTDDQDQVLGGSFPLNSDGTGGSATPMPKTRDLFFQEGSAAERFYIHTPICCPSRAETLTGRYLQNVHMPPEEKQCSDAYNGHDDAGNVCCMHVDEGLVNNFTFARHLSESAGYTVGMFGKYLNNCPEKPPPGWDTWFANGGGNYMDSKFFVKNVDGFADGAQTVKGYQTSVIGNTSVAWIKKVAKGEKPFFAYIGTKAPHEPFTPSPWYENHWEESWPGCAPRPPSFNMTMEQRAKHHPNIASQAVLTECVASCIDDVFRGRWRCLMSVDDLIEAVFQAVEEAGVSNNTYFFYSSDHGFQLGEMNLPFDKRNVYEFDTKIHLLAKGPGITRGSRWSKAATNVDLVPTFLAIAGVQPPEDVDGRSLLPFIVAPPSGIGGRDFDAWSAALPATVSQHLSATGGLDAYGSQWRQGVYIHHQRVGAGNYCGQCHDAGEHHVDQMDNNFVAVRHVPGSDFGNILYAEFQWANGTDYGQGNVDFESPFFFEYFDLDEDPWQMSNIYEEVKKSDPQRIKRLHEELRAWRKCKGSSC